MTAAFVDPLPHVVLPCQSRLDAPFTWIGSVLDRLALQGMRLAFAASLTPPREELDRIRRSAAPYRTADLCTAPRRFFDFLDDEPRIQWARQQELRTLAGGVVLARQISARYEPFHAAGAWRSCAENDVIALEHWMHRPAAAKATVIALHGFTMGQPRADARVLMVEQMFCRGFDVALLTLPFHGCRAPRGSRYSGERFASWDVGCLNESVRQAIHDIDLVRRWCADRGGAPVGLVGLSLGGYLTALSAGLTRDWAFVVPIAPPICLGSMPARLLALAGERALQASPFPLSQLRSAYRVHSPLAHALAVPRERTLIIGGRGDRIAPPEHTQRLWRHWRMPALHWYRGSHTVPFQRNRILERIAQHVLGLLA